jgi:hypothetical protein
VNTTATWHCPPGSGTPRTAVHVSYTPGARRSRRNLPAAMVRVAQECRKARFRIEARPAKPVNGAVLGESRYGVGQKPSKSSTKNNTAASSSRRRSPISGIIRPNLRSGVQFRSNSANPTRRNASIEIRELKSDGTVKVVASPSHGRCRRFNRYAPTITSKTWLVRS